MESAEMDKRSRCRFTREFKAEALALARNSDKPIAETCRGKGLAQSTMDPLDGRGGLRRPVR
jgi:transposase-like protein